MIRRFKWLRECYQFYFRVDKNPKISTFIRFMYYSNRDFKHAKN